MSKAAKRPVRGAIFDVDGVLVDSPHQKAWRDSLLELMEHEWRHLQVHSTWTPSAFTPLVYAQQVSGKPRIAGAAAALRYFGLGDDSARVEEYANRKQKLVAQLIEAGDFATFPDALRFVLRAKNVGLLLATASSSKNASKLLRKIRLDEFVHEQNAGPRSTHPAVTLLDLFDVDMSGHDFARGKPDPQMFLTTAHELGLHPSEVIVVEDAVAGIVAAKRGDMGAIGIARADDAALLTAAGADFVVGSLDDLDPADLAAGRLRPASRTEGSG